MSFAHEATAPGTVTASALSDGIEVLPRSAYRSRLAAAGAQPEPLSAMTSPKAIAANAGLRRFDDAKQRDGRDRGVHRVAAATQHVERGQRCQRVRGCRHDAHTERLGTAGQFEIAGGATTERQETRSANP